MGFDGNGSARGAIQYAFDCIGPRIGIGTVDARLTEIGHAANAPAAMSLDARRQARLRSWPRLTTGAEKHAFGARGRIRKRRHARGRDGSRPSAGKRVPNASRCGSIRVLAVTRAARTRRAGPGPAATTTYVDGARTPRRRHAPDRARPRPCRSPSRSTRRCPTRPSSGSCAVSRRRRHRQARPPSDESALRAAPSSRRTPAN